MSNSLIARNIVIGRAVAWARSFRFPHRQRQGPPRWRM